MGGGAIGRVITIPYCPRPLQASIHKALKRFNVIVLHRRAGKTVLAINQLIKSAINIDSRAGRFAYISPLYRQSKSVAWDFVKYYTSTIPGTKYNESELRVDFLNGARINLYGADNPDSLRGLGLDGCCIDEYAQTKEELWGSVIRPMLVDRNGFAIFIGTPNPDGLDDFYRLYEKAQGDPNWFTALYPASETGIIPQAELDQARKEMTHEQYMREFEVNFHTPSKFGFNESWLRYWDNYNYAGMNRYILVDPANEKNRHSDYTAMMVVGVSEDDNFYVIDMVRDRLNLTERTAALFELHRKYKPLLVGYEKYGKDSDIQHIEYVMNQENYRFRIVPVGGPMKKEDRVRTLVPLFENERIYIPRNILVRTGEGYMRDLIKEFIEEYLAFPNGQHDDMMDCLARINDPNFNMKPPVKPLKRSRTRRAKVNYNVI